MMEVYYSCCFSSELQLLFVHQIRVYSSNVLQFPHVDSSSFGPWTGVKRSVGEEAFEDHVVVDLVDDFGEVVVFPEEAEQLGRRPVDGQEPRVDDLLIGQHGLEEDAAAAQSLP